VEKGTNITLNIYGQKHDQNFAVIAYMRIGPNFGLIEVDVESNSFLGGPGFCPAQQQVRNQAVYLLLRLTREFSKSKIGTQWRSACSCLSS
jgi:hypothetical protein